MRRGLQLAVHAARRVRVRWKGCTTTDDVRWPTAHKPKGECASSIETAFSCDVRCLHNGHCTHPRGPPHGPWHYGGPHELEPTPASSLKSDANPRMQTNMTCDLDAVHPGPRRMQGSELGLAEPLANVTNIKDLANLTNIKDIANLKDIKDFNALIQRCNVNMNWDQLDDILPMMQSQGVQPDSTIVKFLIDAYIYAHQVGGLDAVTRYVDNSDTKLDSSIMCHLILAYKEPLEDVAPATRILSFLAHLRTLIIDGHTYKSLIIAYGELGSVKEIDSVLTNAVKDGIVPDDSTLTTIIIAFCKASAVDRAKGVLQSMLEANHAPEEAAFHAIMNALGKVGALDEVESIFNLHRECHGANSSTYNVLLTTYTKANKFDRIEAALNNMADDNIRPNVVTFTSLINLCCKAQNLTRAADVFVLMKNSGIVPNVVTFNSLIQMYSSNKQIENAERVLNEMVEQQVPLDNTTCNVLLSMYGKSEDTAGLQSVIEAMGRRGLEPDNTTFNTILDAYGKTKDLEPMGQVLSAMQARGIQPDIFTFHALVNAYAKSQCLDQVKELLESMRTIGLPPQVHQYTSALKGCTEARLWDHLEHLRGEMAAQGIALDAPAYGCLIDAYHAQAAVAKLDALRQEIWGLDPNACLNVMPQVAHMFVKAYGKASHMQKVQSLNNEMKEAGIPRNAQLLNALTIAYSRAGNLPAAEGLVFDMLEAGMPPPHSALMALFGGYGREGYSQKAERCLRALKAWKTLLPVDLTTFMVEYRRIADCTGYRYRRNKSDETRVGLRQMVNLCVHEQWDEARVQWNDLQPMLPIPWGDPMRTLCTPYGDTHHSSLQHPTLPLEHTHLKQVHETQWIDAHTLWSLLQSSSQPHQVLEWCLPYLIQTVAQTRFREDATSRASHLARTDRQGAKSYTLYPIRMRHILLIHEVAGLAPEGDQIVENLAAGLSPEDLNVLVVLLVMRKSLGAADRVWATMQASRCRPNGGAVAVMLFAHLNTALRKYVLTSLTAHKASISFAS